MPLGHCEPVTLVTQLDAVEAQMQQIAGLCEHLHDVITTTGWTWAIEKPESWKF
jgi:hypothetical protein